MRGYIMLQCGVDLFVEYEIFLGFILLAIFLLTAAIIMMLHKKHPEIASKVSCICAIWLVVIAMCFIGLSLSIIIFSGVIVSVPLRRLVSPLSLFSLSLSMLIYILVFLNYLVLGKGDRRMK